MQVEMCAVGGMKDYSMFMLQCWQYSHGSFTTRLWQLQLAKDASSSTGQTDIVSWMFTRCHQQHLCQKAFEWEESMVPLLIEARWSSSVDRLCFKARVHKLCRPFFGLMQACFLKVNTIVSVVTMVSRLLTWSSWHGCSVKLIWGGSSRW